MTRHDVIAAMCAVLDAERDEEGWLLDSASAESQVEELLFSVCEGEETGMHGLLESERQVGVPFEGKSGRWFVLTDKGRVVPTKNPTKPEAPKKERTKKEPAPKVTRATPEEKLSAAREQIQVMQSSGKTTPDDVRSLAGSLSSLTVQQIKTLREQLGTQMKITGRKAELVDRLAQAVLGAVKSGEASKPTDAVQTLHSAFLQAQKTNDADGFLKQANKAKAADIKVLAEKITGSKAPTKAYATAVLTRQLRKDKEAPNEQPKPEQSKENTSEKIPFAGNTKLTPEQVSQNIAASLLRENGGSILGISLVRAARRAGVPKEAVEKAILALVDSGAATIGKHDQPSFLDPEDRSNLPTVEGVPVATIGVRDPDALQTAAGDGGVSGWDVMGEDGKPFTADESTALPQEKAELEQSKKVTFNPSDLKGLVRNHSPSSLESSGMDKALAARVLEAAEDALKGKASHPVILSQMAGLLNGDGADNNWGSPGSKEGNQLVQNLLQKQKFTGIDALGRKWQNGELVAKSSSADVSKLASQIVDTYNRAKSLTADDIDQAKSALGTMDRESLLATAKAIGIVPKTGSSATLLRDAIYQRILSRRGASERSGIIDRPMEHATKLAGLWESLPGSKSNQVSLADLKDALGVSQTQLHSLVNQLRRDGILFAEPIEGRGNTSREQSAAMKENGQALGYVGVREDAKEKLRKLAGGVQGKGKSEESEKSGEKTETDEYNNPPNAAGESWRDRETESLPRPADADKVIRDFRQQVAELKRKGSEDADYTRVGIPDFDVFREFEKVGNPQEKTVSILDIATLNQGGGELSRIEEFARKEGPHWNKPLDLIQVGSRYYIVDGNHRLGAALLRGEKNVKARVWAGRPLTGKNYLRGSTEFVNGYAVGYPVKKQPIPTKQPEKTNDADKPATQSASAPKSVDNPKLKAPPGSKPVLNNPDENILIVRMDKNGAYQTVVDPEHAQAQAKKLLPAFQKALRDGPLYHEGRMGFLSVPQFLGMVKRHPSASDAKQGDLVAALWHLRKTRQLSTTYANEAFYLKQLTAKPESTLWADRGGGDFAPLGSILLNEAPPEFVEIGNDTKKPPEQEKPRELAGGKAGKQNPEKKPSRSIGELRSGKIPTHAMTREEHRLATGDSGVSSSQDSVDLAHRWSVEDAIIAGQKVPDEVLKDYPDLQKPFHSSFGKQTTTQRTETIRQAVSEVANRPEVRRLGGIVTIPALVDAIRTKHPDATAKEVELSLRQGQQDDQWTLQKINDPRLDPRAAEMPTSPRGKLGYVHLRGGNTAK